MTDVSIEAKITTFISTELMGNRPVGTDDDLLGAGMVSSLGMVRLVGFIEEAFDYTVPPEDFVIDNFSTVNGLCAYLTRALNGDGDAVDAP